MKILLSLGLIISPLILFSSTPSHSQSMKEQMKQQQSEKNSKQDFCNSIVSGYQWKLGQRRYKQIGNELWEGNIPFDPKMKIRCNSVGLVGITNTKVGKCHYDRFHRDNVKGDTSWEYIIEDGNLLEYIQTKTVSCSNGKVLKGPLNIGDIREVKYTKR